MGDELDTDGSGVVSIEEFVNAALRAAGLADDESVLSKQEAAAMGMTAEKYDEIVEGATEAFRQADLNGNGVISQDEAAEIGMTKEEFDELDRDASGFVTIGEF